MSDWDLRVTAALLRRGAALDRLAGSLALIGLALGLTGLLFNTTEPLLLALAAALVLLGLAQKYWALRVAFDAELFAEMAKAGGELEQNTRSLDAALTNLGLLPAARAGRPWSERCRGALRLLRIQAMLCALQLLLALAGVPLIALTA